MNEVTVLAAESRDTIGTGASRRLRHENLVPGVVYGGKKNATTMMIPHNKLIKALEDSTFYSSVIMLDVSGKQEKVVLQDLQRHPYKPEIMHIDFMRVTDKTELKRKIPLKLVNTSTCKGTKAGGKLVLTIRQITIRCQAKQLPTHIDVDVQDLDVAQVMRLSDLTLPKGVSLYANCEDKNQNLTIVAVKAGRK